jgi:3-isopropylmalate dehydrogenase
MNKTIAVIRGDGIGPEIVGETIGVLDAAAKRFGHVFRYEEAPMGGNAIDVFGVPLPDSSLQTCLASDSVLLGAVGGPKWDAQPSENRPERGLLRLRGAMGLYSNIRPARMLADLSAACPLRADIAAWGIDFVVVRELIGGVYFGKHSTRQENGEAVATDIMAYSEHEIRRIAHVAFRMARKRRKRRVTSVDKANVLDTSRLWRKTVCDRGARIPRRGAAAHVRGQRRHAAGPGPQPVRRDGDGEPLRRHPLRRGQPDHRLHRHDPLGQPGGRQPGPL